MVLALQRENELEHILSFIKTLKIPQVSRINVPDNIIRKTMAMWADYRKEQFKKYFVDSKEIEISPGSCPIRKVGRNEGNLISIRDKYNIDIALGITKKIESGKITIYSPIRDIEEIGCLVFGEVTFDL